MSECPCFPVRGWKPEPLGYYETPFLTGQAAETKEAAAARLLFWMQHEKQKTLGSSPGFKMTTFSTRFTNVQLCRLRITARELSVTIKVSAKKNKIWYFFYTVINNISVQHLVFINIYLAYEKETRTKQLQRKPTSLSQ